MASLSSFPHCVGTQGVGEREGGAAVMMTTCYTASIPLALINETGMTKETEKKPSQTFLLFIIISSIAVCIVLAVSKRSILEFVKSREMCKQRKNVPGGRKRHV